RLDRAAIQPTSRRPKATIERREAWPPTSGCAHSSPTAIAVSERCTRAPGRDRRPPSTSPPRARCSSRRRWAAGSRTRRRSCGGSSLADVLVVVLERHVDERLPGAHLLRHRPRQRPHPQHHAAVVVVELLSERPGHAGALLAVELPRDRVDLF